jgi:hypothetical protein
MISKFQIKLVMLPELIELVFEKKVGAPKQASLLVKETTGKG